MLMTTMHDDSIPYRYSETQGSSSATLQAFSRIGGSLTPTNSIASQLLPPLLRDLSTSSHATLAAGPSALPPAVSDPADPSAAMYQQLLDSSSFQQLSSVLLPAGPLNVE